MIRRRLFNIATAMSLLLLLTTVGMYIRSRYVDDNLVLQHLGGTTEKPVFRTVNIDSRNRHLHVFHNSYFCEAPWSPDVPPDAWMLVQTPIESYYPVEDYLWGMSFRSFLGIYEFSRVDHGYWQSFWVQQNRVTSPEHQHMLSASYLSGVVVPYWSLVLITAVIPVVKVATYLRRRVAEGCCLSCGYNLTGNTSGTCPECGMPVPSKPEAGA